MSSGLASPRIDFGPSIPVDGGARDPGYFAVGTERDEKTEGDEC